MSRVGLGFNSRSNSKVTGLDHLDSAYLKIYRVTTPSSLYVHAFIWSNAASLFTFFITGMYLVIPNVPTVTFIPNFF